MVRAFRSFYGSFPSYDNDSLSILQNSVLGCNLNLAVHIIAKLVNQSFEIRKGFSPFGSQQAQYVLEYEHLGIIVFDKLNVVFVQLVSRILLDLLAHTSSAGDGIGLTGRTTDDDIHLAFAFELVHVLENIINRILSNRRTNRGVGHAFRNLVPEFAPVGSLFLVFEVIFIDCQHSVFLKIMECRSCFQRIAGVLVHFDMRNRRISGSDEAF